MLRKATPTDIVGVLQVINENLDKLLPRQSEELLELLDTLWVIDHEGTIAGCVCLEVYSPKIAEVRSLAVREAYRGLGYGELLVETAVEEARRRHVRQILVVTSQVEFFEKMNFGACLNEKYAMFWNGAGRPGNST
ncbi:MAG TPA: GNAT family N-acetyltransferase [Aggregatilineales bacterium]|nr:GNAT family N-acetyltransferase [Aggregatilineales bacterium]